MNAADTITDEQIRELRCAICGNAAVCVGRYEDMPEPGEPACGECCGHGCEDGMCEPLYYDDDSDYTLEIDPACRARCAEILNRAVIPQGVVIEHAGSTPPRSTKPAGLPVSTNPEPAVCGPAARGEP